MVWQDESVGNDDFLRGWRSKLDSLKLTQWKKRSDSQKMPCPPHESHGNAPTHTHTHKCKKQKRKVFIIQKIKINSLTNFQKEKKQAISHGKMGDHLLRVTICPKISMHFDLFLRIYPTEKFSRLQNITYTKSFYSLDY